MTRRPKPPRPALWTEGRQHPPPEPRAFLRAALIFARQDMGGVTARCAISAAGFGAGVTAGRWQVPAARLGRTGRFLPSHRRVGQALIWGAALLDRASATILPPQAEAEPPLPPVRGRATPAGEPRPVAPRPVIPRPVAPRPVTPRRPAPRREEAAVAPDLLALRALIAGAEAEADAEPPAAAPSRTRAPAPHTPRPEAAPPRPPRLLQGAGWLLGHGLLAMALPWGAVRAVRAHLDGRDLREM